MKKRSTAPIWCDHCGCCIRPKMIRACMRPTCQTKAILDERDRQEARND